MGTLSHVIIYALLTVGVVRDWVPSLATGPVCSTTTTELYWFESYISQANNNHQSMKWCCRLHLIKPGACPAAAWGRAGGVARCGHPGAPAWTIALLGALSRHLDNVQNIIDKIKYIIIGVLTWILRRHIKHGSVACSRCFSPQESRGRQYWSRHWSPLTCAIHQEVIHRRLGRRTLDEQIFRQEIYESFSDPRSHLLGNGSPEIDIQHAWNKS